MATTGTRVIAICSFKDGHLKMYGEGTYIGDLVPNQEPFNEVGLKNPCILLDNGKYVWGMECWWGPKPSVEAKYGLELPNAEIVEPSNVKPVQESEVSHV